MHSAEDTLWTCFPNGGFSGICLVASCLFEVEFKYCLTLSVNRTDWLRGLCKAQPRCKSLQEPEASIIFVTLCATSVRPVSSLSTVRHFSAQSLQSWSYNHSGAPVYFAVFANIKMPLKLTEFLEHHLTSRLWAKEEVAALFVMTWRSLMDSNLPD